MIKKTITYTDYNEVDSTEDFYFNINKIELMELNLRYNGGLQEELRAVLKAGDNAKMFKMIKDLILSSYGMKTTDGKGFIKRPDLTELFQYHPAFDELIAELSSDEAVMNEFIMGVIPGKMSAEIRNHPELMEEAKAELMKSEA